MLIDVEVEGAGMFKGICNGDATSLEVFTKPTMRAFHGLLSVGVISSSEKGKMRVVIKSKGLKKAEMVFDVD